MRTKAFITGLLLFVLLFVLLPGQGGTAFASSDPAYQFYVFYYPNGGTGEPEPTPFEYYWGAQHNDPVEISTVVPTRTGQANLGTYTVTLDANGGIVSQTALTAPYGEAYSFVEWNTARNGSGDSYAPGDYYYPHGQLTDSLRLYAQWDCVYSTEALTLPVPTRAGFAFVGWSTTTDESKLVSDPYCATGNVTLHAVWSIRSGSCGENVQWSLDNNGLLVFSGQGDIIPQDGEAIWLTNNTKLIRSVEIRDGVTGICSGAFAGCANMTSVSIAEGVTSIGSRAFAGCTGLTELTVPSGVTSIGGEAFSGCTGLIRLTVPASVTSVGRNAFEKCSCLTTAGPLASDCRLRFGWTDAIPAYAFSGSALRDVTIPETATSIGSYAFCSCVDLYKATVPGSVTSIGESAFYNCQKLFRVILQDGVAEIGAYAFNGCHELEELTVPASVTSIGVDAFRECWKLTSAGPIDSACCYRFGWSDAIPNRAFSFLKNLSSVTLPDGITSIGDYAFDNCLYLTGISIPASVTSIGSGAFEESGLMSIRIPEGVTSIGSWAFYCCDALRSVTIPESVTSIGGYAFGGSNNNMRAVYISSLDSWCAIRFGGLAANPLFSAHTLYLNDQALRSLVIPASVTTIQAYAFAGCSSLTSVTIPEGVTSIGDKAFYDCDGLIEAAIPASVTSFGDGVFYGCDGMTSVSFAADLASVGTHCFYNCVNLSNVTLPADLTTVGDYCFYGCGSLRALTLPSSVTGIGSFAFYNCGLLSEAAIPEHVRSIGSFAFYGCSGLTEAVIPDGVRKIENYMFHGCGSLTWVTIPVSVTKIGDNAFESCDALADIWYGGGNVDWTLVAIGYGNTPLSTAAIHYGTETQVPRPWGELFWLLDDSGKLQIYGEGPMAAFDSSSSEDAWRIAKAQVTEVVIREGVTSISSFAFHGFTSLTTITIPASITEIGQSAFYGADSLKTVHIDSLEAWCALRLTSWYDSPAYNAHTVCLNGEPLQDLVIPEGVTKINRGVFSGCSALKSVTIPEGVTEIDAYAFAYCSGMTEVTLPESLKSVGDSAFVGCSSLSSVLFNGSKTLYSFLSVGSNNTPLARAPKSYAKTWFGGDCGELQWRLNDSNQLTLSGQGFMEPFTSSSMQAWYPYRDAIFSIVADEGVASIGDYAFYRCTKLTSVQLPDSLQSIGDLAFHSCSKLKSLVLPDSLTSLGTSAFYNCGLESIIVPDSVSEMKQGVFWLCSNLTNVVLPNGLTELPGVCFAQCYGLTTLVIPESVTSIGNGAFRYCSDLSSITIPANVASIGNFAFERCSALKSVTLKGELPQIDQTAFTGVSATVYYPGDQASYSADVMTGYGGTLSWNAVGGFTIRYEANGGNGAPDPQTKLYGRNITLSLSEPVRDGFHFEGWADTAAARAAQYQPGDLFSGNENLTLYAVWKQLRFSAAQVLFLPAALESIEEEAFLDIQAEAVLIPDSVRAIGENAFDGDIVLIASPGGAAEEYADRNGLRFLNVADCVIEHYNPPSVPPGKIAP